MVGDDEHRVRHGEDGPLRPAPGGDAPILRAQVRLFGPRRRLRGGDEGRAQPGVALARPPGALPPGALVVAGGETGPRGEVVRGRELGHVGADLRHQQLRRTTPDAGDGVEQRDDCLLLIGDARLGDLVVETRDRLLVRVELRQQRREQEAVMRPDPPAAGLRQRRALRAQATARQCGEGRRVARAIDDGREHRPPGHPRDVGDHGRERDVRAFQHLLDAVDQRRAPLHEVGPVPRQLAQLALVARRDEAGTHQPVPQQLGDPLRVLHVGLATGHGLAVLRVQQPHREGALQQVVDRLPVVAGARERDVGAAVGAQPVGQREQRDGGGAVRAGRHDRLPTLARCAAADDRRALMHVDPGAAREHDFHRASPLNGLPR